MHHPSPVPDEYPIGQIPDTPWWSENYALMGADPTTRKAVFFGSGRWHGDRTVWRELVLVALPDGRVIFAKGYGRNGTTRGPSGAFAKLDVIKPGHMVRLTYDGPVWQSTNPELLAHGFQDGPTQRCTIDLLFESTVPVWNMRGESPGATNIAGAIHIEQIGKINGVVEYEGKSHYFIDGYSVRDHSRGPREVSDYKGHCWTSGFFPQSKTAFYAYAMRLQGSKALGMSNATIVQDGELHPATILQVNMPESAQDVHALPTIVLKSELGEMTIQATELLSHVITGMVRPYDTIVGGRARQSSAVIVDGPTSITWADQEGYGWSEFGYAPNPL